MKGNFEKSLAQVLKHEGGYVNHSRDPGGHTNLGVTKKVYEKWVGRQVSIDEMKALTPEIVAPIYKKNYWDKMKLDDVEIAGLDFFLFDFAVNSGPGRSAKYIQKLAKVTADGAIGPISVRAINNLEASAAIEEIYDMRQQFYERLDTFDTFGRGWTSRNKQVKEEALEMLKHS